MTPAQALRLDLLAAAAVFARPRHGGTIDSLDDKLVSLLTRAADALADPSPQAREALQRISRRRHELKCWSEPFDAISRGEKSFEYRKEDGGRYFAVGDELVLRRWDMTRRAYTGEEKTVLVSYLIRGPHFGVPEGFVVMSIFS